MVVDLTSIYDNKVTLSVEDKPIARGELVIVNDRYGVKIDEVIAKTPKAENNPNAIPQQQAVPAGSDFAGEGAALPQEDAAAAQPADEEDEFDYSDFELEDEDI